MSQDAHSNQNFAHILRVVSKKKWYIIICILATLCPILYYNQTATPIYSAQASLVFEFPNSGLSSVYQMDALTGSSRMQQSFVLNKVQEIKSRSLAEAAAAALPTQLIAQVLPSDRANDRKVSISGVASYIRKHLIVEQVPNSDIVYLKIEHENPQVCMALPNTLADKFIDKNLNIKLEGVMGVRETIDQQLNFFQGKLEDAEQVLRDFKEKNLVTTLDQQSVELLRRVTEAEIIANQVNAQLKSTEERLASVKSKISDRKLDLVPKITDVSTPSIKRLTDRLIEMELQYNALRVQEYSEEHPKMIQLKDEISQAKIALKEEAGKLAKAEDIVDPVSQIEHYFSEMVSLELERESLKAQLAALQKTLEQYDDVIQELPQKEFELAALLRNKQVNEQIYMMLLQKREETRISEAERVSNVRVIDYAKLPTRPVKPEKQKNLILGLFLSMILAISLVVLQENINPTIETAEEVERLTAWPSLASIPHSSYLSKDIFDHFQHNHFVGRSNGDKVDTKTKEVSALVEAYRILRTNLMFLDSDKQIKTVLITSGIANEGKTTNSVFFALTAAQSGLKTLLIDADLRRPSLHPFFDIAEEPGLNEVLLNHDYLLQKAKNFSQDQQLAVQSHDSVVLPDMQKTGLQKSTKSVDDTNADLTANPLQENNNHQKYEQFIHTSMTESLQSVGIENLKVLTSGKTSSNPSYLLSTKSTQILFEELKSIFDLIVIDSPPVLLLSDTVILSSIVDGIVYVVDSRKTEGRNLVKAKSVLQKANANVLGFIYNRVYLGSMYKYGDYYHYG